MSFFQKLRYILMNLRTKDIDRCDASFGGVVSVSSSQTVSKHLRIISVVDTFK